MDVPLGKRRQLDTACWAHVGSCLGTCQHPACGLRVWTEPNLGEPHLTPHPGHQGGLTGHHLLSPAPRAADPQLDTGGLPDLSSDEPSSGPPRSPEKRWAVRLDFLSLVQRPPGLQPAQWSPPAPASTVPARHTLQEQLLPCRSTSPLLCRTSSPSSSLPFPAAFTSELHSNRRTCLLQARLPPGKLEVVCFHPKKGAFGFQK